jgi:hypothetical protein
MTLTVFSQYRDFAFAAEAKLLAQEQQMQKTQVVADYLL